MCFSFIGCMFMYSLCVFMCVCFFKMSRSHKKTIIWGSLCNCRHPGPRCVWDGGSESRVLTPLRLHPWQRWQRWHPWRIPNRAFYMCFISQNAPWPPPNPPKRGIARGGPGRACGRVWRSFGRALGGSGQLWEALAELREDLSRWRYPGLLGLSYSASATRP